jgi:hypothetical protein
MVRLRIQGELVGFAPRVEGTQLRFVSVAGYAAPSLIVYSLVLLAVWPGQMTADSLTQWYFLEDRSRLTDINSLFHWGALWVVTRFWYSPAPLIIIHIVGLALATGLVLYELRRWWVPMWLLAVTAILFPFFPPVTFVSTTYWTDVPHAIFLVLCLYFILRTIREDGVPLDRIGFVLAFGLTLLAMGFMRKNGIIAAVIIVMPVAFLYRGDKLGRWRWPIIVTAVIVLVVPQTVREWGFGSRTFPAEFKGVPPLHVLGAYAYRDALIPEHREFINKMTPLPLLIKNYRCDAESSFFIPETDRRFIGENIGQVWRITFAHMLDRPLIFLRHWACATELLWKPHTQNLALIGYPPLEIDDNAPNNQPDKRTAVSMGLDFSPKLPALRPWLRAYFDWSIGYDVRAWFWRPAGALYLTVAIAVLMAWRHDRRVMLLIAVPSVANFLSMAPLIINPAYRYSFGVTCIALMLIPLLITELWRAAAEKLPAIRGRAYGAERRL